MIEKLIVYFKLSMHLKWCLECRGRGTCKRILRIIDREDKKGDR